MPFVEEAADPEVPLVGPGGRIIVGWNLAGPPDRGHDLANSDDDHQALRKATYLLLQQAEAQLADRFLIIERSSQHYMQCLRDQSGWLLEKREGDKGSHYRALAPKEEVAKVGAKSLMTKLFERTQVRRINLDTNHVHEAMTSFLLCQSEPEWLDWERVEV